MTTRLSPTSEPVDNPISWDASGAFLKYGIRSTLAIALALFIGVYFLLPGQTMRLAGCASIALVAAIAWALHALGRNAAAVHTMAVGIWLAVTGIAYFSGGMHSTIIIVYPQLILLLGWMFGMRYALAAALVTVATAFGLVLAESWALLPQPPATPPALRWIILSFVLLFAVFLIAYLVRSYQNRVSEAGELGRDLARSNAEIRARENDLHRAQAVAHVGSWVYDLANDTMRMSAETCRIFTVPEGTTGSHDTYLARVHPDDREAVEMAWKTALDGGAPFDNEHRIAAGKTHRWIRQVAELERDGQGVALRSVGTTQDITERKRAELSLRESEARYHSLFADSSVSMLLIDATDRTIVDANAAACRYYGWSLAQLQSMRISDINTLDTDAVRIEMESARRKKKGHFDFRHRLASGEVRDVEVFSGPVEINGRELLISLVHDVTVRRKAQEELTKSIAFRELLLEAMPLPVFYKDASGRYTGCNSAFTRFVGKPASEIVGKTVSELASGTYAQSYRDKDIDLLNDPAGLQTYESKVAHVDGTVHDVIFHKASMVDENGRPAGILGVITDITEIRRIEVARDQLEAQLRESQKMEALGTLAGGVAHDFNNVLAAIMGNVELASQDAGAGHAAQESLEEIRKASRRARDMVQQILAFGRRQVLAREVTSLAPVVEESMRLLRKVLPAGVSLVVECAPDAPAVLADPTQIEQVLLNLCNNAWQAMQGQARPALIEVRLDACVHAPERTRAEPAADRCAELRPGLHARLTVRDTGPGMDAATRARIFEPFFTTKPVGKGTGLGLAVVHGVALEHGASIEVESEPGAGTTFRICFPAAQAPAPAAESTLPEKPPAHGLGRHILYLDDDEAIVFLMKRLLERQGYRVSGYTDAEEALAAARADPRAFDLAVTDFNMPGLSGLDVARALRDIRADLPVALASGYITDELRTEAPAAGVRELVYKPNTADELCEVIARLADARRDTR